MVSEKGDGVDGKSKLPGPQMTATVVGVVVLGGNSLYATCATLSPASSISWSSV